MDFKKIIERIKTVTCKTQKELASDIFGISEKNLSNKIKRGSVDLDAIVSWAGNFSVDLNWLLTGKGEPYANESPAAEPAPAAPRTNNIVEIQHVDLVKLFADKPRAKSANVNLLEIEKLDHDTFVEVVGYIKGVANNLRTAAERQSHYGADRRKHDRRQSGDNDDIPGGTDRRSGSDRRKTAGGGR